MKEMKEARKRGRDLHGNDPSLECIETWLADEYSTVNDPYVKRKGARFRIIFEEYKQAHPDDYVKYREFAYCPMPVPFASFKEMHDAYLEGRAWLG